MKIAALSDFHIGSMAWADPFGHSEEDFLGFLDRLEAGHDHIVLLGDIYQTDHGLLPGAESSRRQLDAERDRYPRLAERMAGPGYHYIGGNHDDRIWNEVGAVETLRLEGNGFAALFIHGHQFDPLLNGPVKLLSNFSTWVAGRLRRLNLVSAVEQLEFLDVGLKDAWFSNDRDPYAKAARRLLEEHGVDVVVMAHTHIPERMELEEGILVNSGSCSRGRKTHVSIDTENCEVTLVTD
jgi:predicted phosphodiesterase